MIFDPAAYFRFFAAEARRGGSPLLGLLSDRIADDEALIALAAKSREGQPPANLLFAAVHYLLLDGADHPLKDYYASLGGAKPADAGAFATFKDFALAREAEIAEIVSRRVTNTNEVGRSAALMPGFCFIAAAEKRALALIELGPSAGLNLNFDLYEYRYLAEDGAVAAGAFGPSPVVIDSKLKGAPPPLPPRPPEIASRIGLELNPVDLQLAEDRRWLKALVWPERAERLRRLDAAIALAARRAPPIRAGDAAANLPAALLDAPAEAQIVVYHSAFAYQLPDAARTAIDEAIAGAARARPVWRLAMEDYDISGKYFLRATLHHKDQRAETTLAETNPHGQWLDWRGGSTTPPTTSATNTDLDISSPRIPDVIRAHPGEGRN